MTPYLPQYSGIWEISTLTGHLHFLIKYNKWKIAFSWAWPPGKNLWTTTHRPVYMWAPAAAAAFCRTNKPPCAFNLFMTSKRNPEYTFDDRIFQRSLPGNLHVTHMWSRATCALAHNWKMTIFFRTRFFATTRRCGSCEHSLSECSCCLKMLHAESRDAIWPSVDSTVSRYQRFAECWVL